MTIPKLITALVGWAAARFYDVERLGPRIPGRGPVLVVANHPNSLLDPLVIFRTAGRMTRPLARAPLFDRAVVGMVVRGLGGIPVYRREDDPSKLEHNAATFERAVAALLNGEALQIYPEGRSHSEPSLAPLRTGAARIAFMAEAQAGWNLGLRIVPVGLTYSRKHFFRGRALAAVGEPFTIQDLRVAYETDAAAGVRQLTARIAERLEALTLNLSEQEDLDLIETADRIYAREKGWVDWREREGLGRRLPRFQQFARGLAWLRAHDPQRHRRLAQAVRRYQRQVTLLGVGDADVPPRYRPGAVLTYIAREGLVLGISFPFAVAGLVLWYLPCSLPRLAERWFPVVPEAVATYKLAATMVVAILYLSAWGLLAFWFRGAHVAFATIAAVGVLGLIALSWTGRWGRVWEDTRLFLRLLPRPRRLERLARQRARLVAEFDALVPLVNEAATHDSHRDPR